MKEVSWQNNLHLQTEMDCQNEFFYDYDPINDDSDDFFSDIILQQAPPTPFSSESESDHSFRASNTVHNTSFLPSAAVNAVASKRSAPRTYILSFDSSTVVPATPEPSVPSSLLPAKRALHTQSPTTRPNQASKRTRTSSQTVDHIMAERKRRQELTERFIALSATIPGLNKTDKASVLRAAIDYVKQLKEKVDELEKQNRKSAAETVILVNKSDSNGNEDNSNSTETNCSILPEMEARVLGKEVLIEIHCEKEYGVELKILDHLENLHLCVTGSSVLPFGNSALCITITAQMDEEYEMTVNDLVKNLREVLSKSHLVSDSDPY
ncbi:transcription factor bHLH18 [Vigna radiata var. radiata]|uniref:Transcription factor bHLH18 n=1 Tax=Vigna radiata var. radiata TaxID=3916 RepID=A0A1S3VC24_VIGRR|nr:transcription factor bHLH18 [Vigna radiata var. radiata]